MREGRGDASLYHMTSEKNDVYGRALAKYGEHTIVKEIKLSVAQRYLRRHPGAIECLDAIGIETVARSCASGPAMPSFRPAAGDRVFLRRESDQMVFEITEGLPTVTGYFVPLTGEFKVSISYEKSPQSEESEKLSIKK